jgi:hypothetical protein
MINAGQGQQTLCKSLVLWYAYATGIMDSLDIYKMVYITRFFQPYDMDARMKAGEENSTWLQLFGSN